MRANLPRRNSPITKRAIVKEVSKQLPEFYDEIFADCANDVMQQTLANVLLCLERDYGFGKKRLTDFVKQLQGWCDIMSQDTELTKAWSTDDNIEYFKKKYGIDVRECFSAEVTKS